MRCGILIIGSLLWDDSNERAVWRAARLEMASQVPVRAPIYYGRKSGEKRGNTFTMTFGTGESSAQGVVVPCVAKIAGIAELIREANALWRAEDGNAKDGQIHKSWGCVGALFSPNMTGQKLAADWAEHFRSVEAQGVSVVGADGRLGIPWPVTSGGEPTDFDVILSTATKPEAARPAAREVADAWIAQTGGHENYFFENVRHGIRTSDDGDIWCRIEEQSPSWLKPEAHKQAIDILRAERVAREPAPDQPVSAEEDEEEAVPVPSWLRATMADLQNLDFEAPIATSKSADAGELSELFHASTKEADPKKELPDSAGKRIAILLSSVTGMGFHPDQNNEPFSAMVRWADGRRSAIPSDFSPGHIDLLAELANRSKHPVLRTRLADVCWHLDRKRSDLGILAHAGYGEIVTKANKGELLFRFEKEPGALLPDARDYLRRGLYLSRRLGWEKPKSIAIRDLVVLLRKRAVETRALVPLHWFSELDLDFGVSDPKDVGEEIEKVLANLPSDAHSHIVVDLWRLAARAYQQAKRDEDRFRCQATAAEHLFADAEAAAKKQNSAMMAAHWLSAAIAQLHGIPGKKERRTELRHKLIDIQARIPEEMSSFSQELDLRDIAERVEKALGKASLLDKLFIFASLSGSPDPEELTRNAEESIRQHPLAYMFSTSHMDHEGKVIHRTEGAGAGDPHKEAIANQIAQTEGIRRKLAAFGQIETARRGIMNEHALSDDTFRSLLQHSAFVPDDLVATFSRGFLRFFQGDFVSATYILTPLLENLRQRPSGFLSASHVALRLWRFSGL